MREMREDGDVSPDGMMYERPEFTATIGVSLLLSNLSQISVAVTRLIALPRKAHIQGLTDSGVASSGGRDCPCIDASKGHRGLVARFPGRFL